MPNQLLTTGAAPYLYSVHGMTKYTSSFSLIYMGEEGIEPPTASV